MITSLERFEEFVKERDLKLSDYELFYWAAVLASYPKTAPKPCFNIYENNAVYIEVRMKKCDHELTIGKNSITYSNNDLSTFQDDIYGNAEHSVIEMFFKAIQNG